MVRDRLPQLRQLRVATTGVKEDWDAFAVQVESGQQGFLDDFFTEVQEITDLIDKIESRVNDLKQLHSAILSSPQQDERTKTELEATMGIINQNADRVKRKLRSIEEILKREEPSEDSYIPAKFRIQQIQHNTLSYKFAEAMADYNSAQDNYRTRCKNRIQRQLEITGRKVSIDEIEDMLETGNPSVFVQGIIVETQKAKQSLADIEARHNDIMKLEKSIRELHAMFLDLALLVETQGELVHRIEHNVSKAKEYTQEGMKKARGAEKLRRLARKKQIILILVALVVLTIIVVAIVLTYGI